MIYKPHKSPKYIKVKLLNVSNYYTVVTIKKLFNPFSPELFVVNRKI